MDYDFLNEDCFMKKRKSVENSYVEKEMLEIKVHLSTPIILDILVAGI
jgi:hypothetical protein